MLTNGYIARFIMYSAALLQMVFSLSKTEAETTGNHSKLVYPGSDGKLVYQPYTDKGDIIPDFSNCGYMGGGVAYIPITEDLASTKEKLRNELRAAGLLL